MKHALSKKVITLNIWTHYDISLLVGNILGRFDSSLYNFLAPVMAPFFFPHHDPVVQLIVTYLVSAISLFVQPLGMLLFSALAHKHGPLYALSYSSIGMAITTIGMSMIPDYELIGEYAPLFLVSVRLAQGIFAAGESTIAKLHIIEHKNDHHALHVSYWYQCTSVMGIVIASAVATFIIVLHPIAWRFVFGLSGIAGLLAYWLRMSGKHFHDSAHAKSMASLSVLWHHKRSIISVAVVTCVSYCTYAIPFVFLNNFVPMISSITLHDMMVLNTSLLVCDMVMIPLVGRIALEHKSAKMMAVASALLGVTLIPLFYFLPNASLGYVTCVRVWIMFWGILFLCPLQVWCKSLFNATVHVDYLLVGVGNTIAAAVGRTITPICLWLWYISGIVWLPALYCTIIMIAAAYVILQQQS